MRPTHQVNAAIGVGALGAFVGLWAVGHAHEAVFHVGVVLLPLSGVLLGWSEGFLEGERAAIGRLQREAHE